jgi:methyl-accepting chemotaxis protein
MFQNQKTQSLSLAWRLGLGFACILLLLLIVAGLGRWSSGTLYGKMQEMTGPQAHKVRLVNDILASVNALGIHARSVVMLGEIDVKTAQVVAQKAQETQKHIELQESVLADLLKNTAASSEERQFFDSSLAAGKATLPLLQDAMKAALDGDSVSASISMMKSVAPREALWAQKLTAWVEMQSVQSAAATQDAEVTYSRANAISIGLVMLSVVLGMLIAWRITLSITLPIGRAVVVAERIANGDLTSQVQVYIHDETGRLLEAIAAMQDKLRTLVGQISSTASVIAANSSEVASGNFDLSNRTEQASNNLQGVASTLNTLSSTVEQSAVSVRQANQVATQASNLASLGGEQVAHVVSTMTEISTSSRKIADITAVIDGISFQTNILALNAAVEAARAGEQGRGFAVVAGEVRSLAGRAANAAREIKILINDSVERVQLGSAQVEKAGKTIDEMVTGVQQVCAIMGEITMTTQDQSDSITTVSHAVAQLDRVTQQNTALVEEGAAAADSLKSQASHLTGMVGAFKLTR